MSQQDYCTFTGRWPGGLGYDSTPTVSLSPGKF